MALRWIYNVQTSEVLSEVMFLEIYFQKLHHFTKITLATALHQRFPQIPKCEPNLLSIRSWLCPTVCRNSAHSREILLFWDIVLTYCRAWVARETMKMGFLTFLSFVMLSVECFYETDPTVYGLSLPGLGRLPIRNVSSEFVSKCFLLFLKLFDWKW